MEECNFYVHKILLEGLSYQYQYENCIFFKIATTWKYSMALNITDPFF
jgi:hypothetical protein